MNAEIKQKWIKALRSGQFKQGREWLQRNGRFCCLGVLCELAVDAGIIPKPISVGGGAGHYMSYSGWVDNLPSAVCVWAGLIHSDPRVGKYRLSVWNDGSAERSPVNFDKIAELITNYL